MDYLMREIKNKDNYGCFLQIYANSFIQGGVRSPNTTIKMLENNRNYHLYTTGKTNQTDSCWFMIFRILHSWIILAFLLV